MPKRRAEELLAGDVSVSLCPATGSPIAVLAHPDGGSCHVAVRGAKLVSWCPARDGGADRLRHLSFHDEGDASVAVAAAPPSGGAAPTPLAGMQPLGLATIVPAEAWTVETLAGRKEPGGPVTFSVFAEVPAGSCAEAGPTEAVATPAGAAPVAARAKFSLWPDLLLCELEVANAAEESDQGEGSSGGAAGATLSLGRCGFVGQLCQAVSVSDVGAMAAPGMSAAAIVPEQPPEALLLEWGLRLETDGFDSMSMAHVGDVQAVRFQAVTTVPVTLSPGDCLSGHISLGLI